jgi:hypothetical protein
MTRQYGNRSDDGRWMEDDVHVDGTAERQLDALEDGGGKTGQIDPDAVHAEQGGRHHEPSVRARECIALEVRLEVPRRHPRAWHDSV